MVKFTGFLLYHYFTEIKVYMRSYLLFIFTTILLTSCYKSELERKNEELAQLKQKITTDSSLIAAFSNELNDINNTLDAISLMDDELHNFREINKRDAIEKLTKISKLLAERANAIDSLNVRLKKSSTQLPLSVLDSKKAQINFQKQYYEQLISKVSELEDENILLSEILEKQKFTSEKRERILKEMSSDFEKLELKHDSLCNAISKSYDSLDFFKVEAAQMYFETAIELRVIAHNTNKILNRKKKKMLTRLAYNTFLKAKVLGFEKAQKEITSMQNSKEFSKFITE